MDINFNEFHFIRPMWLLALLPYVVILILLVRTKLSQGVWTALCDADLLPYLLQDKAVSQSRLPLLSGALAGFLGIIALAGPTWERLPTPVFRNDAALVIALDLSHSMDAADIKPSRLTMARYKIADTLKQRKDGQTALLVFAGDAFTVTPLTNDTATISNQLTALTTDIMPSDGNNISAALEKAVSLLKQAGLQKGQILLIGDGGKLDKIDAKSLGSYQLSVLGVGTSAGAPIALQSGGFLKNYEGDIVVDKLDIDGLKSLANAGGGSYQSLTADDSDIQSLLSTFIAPAKDQGETSDNLLLDQWRDNGPWLLLAVLPLAALSFRKGLLIITLIVLMPLPKNSYAVDLDWQSLWKSKDQQAQEAFNNQQYDKASELFENPDWKAAALYKTGRYDKALENFKAGKTGDSFYNQGNALAQSGQLQAAIDAYKKALAINPNDDDAKYNKALIEKELEKQKQEQQQNQQQNKDKNKDSNDTKKQEQKKDGDKSGNPEQDQSHESRDEQNQDEQKPEQKPEQSQESTEQQADKQSEEPKEQENKPESAKPEKAGQSADKEDAKKPDASTPQPLEQMTAEQKQASEQWLKRIPDDPAGLLKRKFKYQYDQRNQR
ncbi:hypothetical protein MCAMS1_00099 [biofilm metagenome]